MLDEVVGAEHDAAARRRGRSCPTASGRGGAGPAACGRANSSSAPSRQRPRDGRRARPSRGSSRHRQQRGRDVLAGSRARHHASANSSSALGVAVVVARPRREQVERATSAPERRARIDDEPEVVHVLVGDDDQLEVLDAVAVRGERALERVQRRAGVRARCRRSVSGSSSIR